MFFKKLLLLLLMPINVLAYSDYIIAGGENIGIELNSKGVLVVGIYKINNQYTNDLTVGDLITSVNDSKVSNVEEMVDLINNTTDGSIKIGYLRSNILNYSNVKLYKENNIYKTGLYVKDSIIGIGTLTFIDPETKIFGALGHEIIESNTGKKLEIKDGKIFKSDVVGINRSNDGNVGEKNANYNKDELLGNIYENTNHGVFGYYDSIPNKNKYKVAKINEIKLGNAKILTVLNKSEINEYDIEIIKLSSKNQDTKNILFKITDEELLNKTGGIIQGMSGSPIIQGNYIIGAVTHAVVDDPTKGYGIYIIKMLEEAEN